ncbi:hypothetical protein BQ8482_120020 [Mesorhizobium delmotii]|uniref:Uncharacterized protein n=1 Tax=Mesorhizobium delmotii TaxID=1631247 RepID=A0A2P9AFT7_9HYPH|nr:hypothetical protein BQ8482_120020 [Mesorhizobium delmotii]
MVAAPTVAREGELPEPPARPVWGFDRAVLFWDSAVNDSLKFSGTN